ncbi:formate dehydrogenase subunit gamma [Pseudoalteromonas denitrificans]|uniref:NADH-quinone oxidoreductase subunit E n=1 Tax=Pseudoalteromonas denitrificans DSM 6059 TaxID=1123010 RepID=A0A1I1LII6_9GAMM|nr:formate dehydrogenase subunit gamma [Pseudoalteromonas denitrificans]SFC69300.1 formate dehydrogenase gamma subunit [Pseudoalteromonas denitrificans DSM 6059]
MNDLQNTSGNADAQLNKLTIIVDSKKDLPGGLLPILHDIQHEYGFIPKVALGIIATKLNQTEAEIHGVISFYHHFRLTEPGANIVEICRGEACQAMGSKQLENHAKTSLNIDFGQTTTNKNVTLEPVYCLGNCACAPSVKVGDNVHGRMNDKKFDKLMNKLTTFELSLSDNKLQENK